MAPECLLGEPYNLKADVYSFSILLWEILTGRRPYMIARGKEQLVDIVGKRKYIYLLRFKVIDSLTLFFALSYYAVEDNERPDIDKSWPDPIQATLESSFDSDMANRPVRCSDWFILMTLISY